MAEEKRPIATFICHRHSNVPGQKGPFEAPVHCHTVHGGAARIDCPICARVYVLKSGSKLVFESDRELEVLKIEWR